ncbi:MAG: cell division protein SepF [Candidatus Ranarchaeia archaeon]
MTWLRRFRKDKSPAEEKRETINPSGTVFRDANTLTDTPPSVSHLQANFHKDEVYIKSIPLLGLEQVSMVGDEVRNGNIVILDTEPMSLSKKQRIDLRRAIDQLRGICREFGGDLAQLGESYYIVITPPFIKIWERQEETQAKQDANTSPSQSITQ